MGRRPSPAVFISLELENFLRRLPSNDKRRKWIDDIANVLEDNMFAGESIRKNQIPKCYIKDYGVNNLHRYDHPEAYRSCYTIFNRDRQGPCPTILDIMDHKTYCKRFGYTR